MGIAAMVQTGSQLGPYRLLRRIGSGGMAEVFLAQRIGAEGFARTVAIKTILAVGAEEEGISLFLDEARVAGFLEHAAVVQTVDLGYENDTLFIVMEYIAGPSLSRVIRDLKKLGRFLSPEVVAHVGARVAAALDYAHRRAHAPDGTLLRLVHRDISPQNIMLTRTGMVKLTDFGVARASVQTHRTRTGQVRGKAAYMAPEQVRAGQLDGRTDIFALCLVLYEGLTGVRAFQRKTDIMSMRAILTDSVQPIPELNPAVPDALVQVIMRGLAKKPQERWATAGELAEALQATHRSRSEALIEGEITAVIDELFGPEQFASEENGLAVEAWQPTITAEAEGASAVPHKLAGAKLSPKIAALLQGPEASSPAADPENEVLSDFNQSAIDDDAAGAVSSPSGSGMSTHVAYAGLSQGIPLRPGTQPRLASVARGPGMGAQEGGPTPLSTDPRALAEPFSGGPAALHGPGGYATGLSGYGLPGAATGASGVRSLPGTAATTAHVGGRAIVWGAVALGALLVVSVAVILRTRSQEKTGAEAAPLKPVGEARAEPTRPGAVVAHEAAGHDERTAPRTLERGAPRPPEKTAPQPPEKTAPQPALDPSKRVKPSGVKEEAPIAPTRPEPPAKKDGPEAFLARAAAAKRKAEGDPELKRQLTTLIMDISVAPRDPTAAELELVRRAEAK